MNVAINPFAVLQQVFTKVLDEQMFLFAELADLDEAPEVTEKMLRVSITYTGDAQGQMTLYLSLGLCSELAGSVLGVDEEELGDNIDIRDTARELLNMTCGQFLTAYYGYTPVMNLQPPLAEEILAEQFAECRRKFNGLAFMIDEHLVMLEFQEK